MSNERKAPISRDIALRIGLAVRALGDADAKRMLDEALKRNPTIASPEELFDEIYRGEEFA